MSSWSLSDLQTWAEGESLYIRSLSDLQTWAEGESLYIR
jgi:hypothetical protein